MSLLKIFDAADPCRPDVVADHERIATELDRIGVRFERWQASQPLSRDADQDAVIAAYRNDIDTLMAEYGFRSVDVIALGPDHPDREALRAKFLAEHSHSDFEVRFFVAGQGLFYIHVGDKVYGVLCQQGDLISVPANVNHWFDMGEAPDFKCIRLFTTEEGWVARYSGDKIAEAFPTLEQFQA